MVIMLSVFAAALGLVAGSFANVLIYRLPIRESIVYPGSHCPHCGGAIPWYLNVPVLSWVLLRGRCARCSYSISLRYPIVEAAMGGLFLASFLLWGLSVDALAGCLFSLFCLPLGLIDLEHQILPDKLTYPGILIGLALSPFLSWTSPWQSVAGAAAGAGLPAAVIGVYALFGIEAMGWGDVKLLAMVGAFLGWQGMLMTLLGGAILGTLIGGTYLLLSGKGRRTPLPFGTFLCAAALGALFWAPALWAWYAGLFFKAGP